MKKLIYLFLTLLIVACSDDDRIINDTNNTLEKEWLYTHTALEATATSSTTIVIPFTEDIFAFTDRPNREHKYISGDEFASYWNDYDDENSFKLDPPNAVLTWVDGGNVEEVEVVITDADFDGNNVIYTIENTTITANQSFEDVSLFVDGNGSSNNVYLASNGITVKASAGAVAGDTGTIDGFTFTIVDNNDLQFAINNGEELNNVCTSLITNMIGVFENNSTFNQNISSWDVSSVTDMSSMFESATAFNQDISSWSVSNVTNMSGMFANSLLNQDISSWDVSSVTDMSSMFNYATVFNQSIGDWDVSNVTDMARMFTNNSAFNQPIGNWNVSSVTDMDFMFYAATSYNQDLSSWSVANVTSCGNFSQGATSWTLPQPNFLNCDPN